MSMEEYIEIWMEEYANVKVRERTLRGYRTIVNNHIKPAFGSVMLDELTSRHIQRYYADCMKRGLSARTVHHIHRLLSQSLRQAVGWDMTEKNSADDATPPTPTRPDIVPLSPAQTQRVMQIASGTDYFIPIFLGIYTGMRRSEVLGLIWRNVHLEQNGIAVLQTMVDIPGDPTHIAQPKSKTSRRSISISDNITRVLRQHRHDMFFDHARHSLTLDEEAQVCGRPGGELMKPDALSKAYKKIARAAGVPRSSSHTLRHTHVSMLLAAGVPIKTVQERLGHASIQTTMDTYGHLMENAQAEAAERLDDMIGLHNISELL